MEFSTAQLARNVLVGKCLCCYTPPRMQWRWGKTYTVRCPDGSRKTVYRNIDDAFPLFIPGLQRDLSASFGGSAKVAGVDKLKAEIKNEYVTKVQGLLFAIDELTQSLIVNFRSVYLTYASDPCNMAGFLQRQVEKVIAEQQRLTKHRLNVRVFIELAKNQPEKTLHILTMYKEIAGELGSAPALEATKMEIMEARQLADKWVSDDGN